MRPPFKITSEILKFTSEISRLMGKYEGLHAPIPQPQLRRQNRVKTIKDSLAIEGNTLGLEQVTALFEGKRVLGPEQDIREVQNAIRLYESLHDLKPTQAKDLLWAHGILMKGLTPDAGRYRQGSVGIFKAQKISHIAPSAKHVPKLMGELFEFLKSEKELSPLIQACVFHYELEFIHPFSDGNGRIGRFWQSLILTKFHEVFEYIPVESLMRQRQAGYYEILEHCDKKGDSTEFIEFSLEAIGDALKDLMDNLKPSSETPQSRLEIASKEFGQHAFSRKDYLRFFKTISTATASRDLALGVKSKRLVQGGTQATAKYHFKK
jgi:Fic family protein